MKQHQMLLLKRFPKTDVMKVSASLDSKPKTQSIVHICAENQPHVAHTHVHRLIVIALKANKKTM